MIGPICAWLCEPPSRVDSTPEVASALIRLCGLHQIAQHEPIALQSLVKAAFANITFKYECEPKTWVLVCMKPRVQSSLSRTGHYIHAPNGS
jgi:hypothetical protein